MNMEIYTFLRFTAVGLGPEGGGGLTYFLWRCHRQSSHPSACCGQGQCLLGLSLAVLEARRVSSSADLYFFLCVCACLRICVCVSTCLC